MGIAVRIEVDEEAVVRALRESRRELKRDVAQALGEAAERHALPVARRRAPGFVSGSLVIRTNASGARMTTTLRGTPRKIAGLLEFGGTVATPIRPKRARALSIGGGIFRGAVTTPRTYRGKAFMRGAVAEKADAIARETSDEVAKRMQARIDAAGAGS